MSQDSPKTESRLRCRICGESNPGDAWICEACGADLVQDSAQALTTAPLRWWVVGAFVVLVVAPLALSYLVTPLRGFSLHLNSCIELPPASASKLIDEVPGSQLPTVTKGLRCESASAASKVLRKAGIAHSLILRNDFAVCARLTDAERKRAKAKLSSDEWKALQKLEGCLTATEAMGMVQTLRGKSLSVQFEISSSPGIGWPTLCFALAAILLTLVTRRRIGREIALGSVVGVLAQVLFWLGAQDWNVGLVLGANLHIVKGAMDASAVSASNIVMPMVAFTGFVGVAYWLAAQASTALTSMISERVTRRASCRACGKPYSTDPLPKACPACGVGVASVGPNWSWIFVGVAATGWLYFMVMTYASGPLGFFHKCDSAKLTTRCQTAYKSYLSDAVKDTAYVAGRKRSPDTAWNFYRNIHMRGKRGQFILIHTTKYVLYLAALFFFAPFLIGWRVGGQALQSAGISIPLCWGAATLVGFLFFDMAAYTQAAFVLSMRLHMIALGAWGAAGFAGAIIGYKLGSRAGADLLSQLDQPGSR